MDNFWVIGDVAGEYDALMKLLALLPKDAKLVFVGDLNDRGPKTKEVIEFVRSGGYVSLMGNHEYMFIDYVTSRNNPSYMPEYKGSIFLDNGGIPTLRSYFGKMPKYGDPVPAELKEHIKWLNQRPSKFEAEGVIVTHAPILFGQIENFDEMTVIDKVWNRDHIKPTPKFPDDKFQFFGHNGHYHEFTYERNDIYVGPQKYAICVDDSRNNKLTAVNWPSLEKIQVKF